VSPVAQKVRDLLEDTVIGVDHRIDQGKKTVHRLHDVDDHEMLGEEIQQKGADDNRTHTAVYDERDVRMSAELC
jgi:hypothetical protein